MLDYEWGNPSSILLSGEEPTQDSDQTRQISDQYNQTLSENYLQPAIMFSPNHCFQQQQQQSETHFQSLYDSRAYNFSYPPPPVATHSLESVAGANRFLMEPKNEEVSLPGGISFPMRIGLNLGGRTYFSSEDDFVNRLYRRSRPVDPGPSNSPRCQAEGCNADLTHSKHYHRRHKVCEFHSKASTVLAGGLTQRFCQQCSRFECPKYPCLLLIFPHSALKLMIGGSVHGEIPRAFVFHPLSEFDHGKRSCRKRLADHNRRRRKSQQQLPQSQLENARNSPSENPTRSSPESGAHSSSSMTIPVSPPRMSLDCFPTRQYQASASSSSSSSFFSPVGIFRPYERQIRSSSYEEEEEQ
ncbi:hypothetical protein HHK36_028646 [Tetracentron sinense]|uniref:SBP-type domain-containing protein n=1 Tax=Tetracentron sinense TaxID=13715 RepID=A0A834YFS2_TETSI|nr:hypothetical protein HHK36_028646 [Tetracentron sinense]